jgi:hypothetical protein
MIGNATPTEIPDAAGLGFVLVELDLGATFCEVALSTQNEEDKERNTRNARKTYDSVPTFFAGAKSRECRAGTPQREVFALGRTSRTAWRQYPINAAVSSVRGRRRGYDGDVLRPAYEK